ncbi:MAG: TPM domain-containing protein, partial [Cyanobacteria bacterium HKST-UBA03]|nr:TPM domain-containing protein [Cyanobacteria bacterium HKST-UBA03]
MLGCLTLPVLPAFSAQTVIDAVPPAPVGPHRYVQDWADLLSDEQETGLLNYLASLDEAGVAQVAVVTLPDTTRELSAFSPEIMNAWGLGDKGKDNGLLVLANAKRIVERLSGNRIFVGTGYGLEGTLPDAVVGRVLDEQALPAFAEGQYGQGIVDATMTYGELLRGDTELRDHYTQSPDPASPWVILVVVLIFIVLRLLGVPIRFSGGSGGGGYSGGGGFGGGC